MNGLSKADSSWGGRGHTRELQLLGKKQQFSDRVMPLSYQAVTHF